MRLKYIEWLHGQLTEAEISGDTERVAQLRESLRVWIGLERGEKQ